jgi:hypothetical protein
VKGGLCPPPHLRPHLLRRAPPAPDPDLLPDILDLAGDPDRYHAFERAAARVNHCAHPIRLHGCTHQADRQTGELREVYSTEHEPGRVLLVPCGNRRASVCPACAETYRQDAYQLLRAGLAGGKGVPESVAEHPALFVTFTAPSFGPVHATRTTRAGRLLPCQPRRHARTCPHGVRLDCRRVHPTGDPTIGAPLCPRCYDYAGALLWNARAPELWRYTLTYLDRALARALGVSTTGLRRIARREFAKVAEYQARGLIYFHAILRLDAATPKGEPKQYAPPPPQLDTDLLAFALRAAAGKAAVPVPDPDDPTVTRLVRWGDQLDIRPITAGTGGKVTPEQVAGYVAKYATKHTEALGPSLDHRLDHEDITRLPHRRRLRPHITRLVQAAWTLGGSPHLAGLRLRAWAHQLGFGGHWSTRSRAYSTTMTALRRARRTFQHTRGGTRTPLDAWGRPESEAAVLVLKQFTYAGRGWRTEAERWLAVAAAARAREHRRLARQERATAA